MNRRFEHAPGASRVIQTESTRELAKAERQLLSWMLEHGEPEALEFLPQLEKARVTPWRCPCGCASINFAPAKQPEPLAGLHTLADFLFGGDDNLSGVFVYEQSGILSGLEVYGLAGDAPKTLPTPEMLRPFAKEKKAGAAGMRPTSADQSFVCHKIMKFIRTITGIFAALLLVSTDALATFNYEYGPDEYVTISNGISPDRKLAITTHGEGESGYEKFHIYLFDAVSGKKIGPLEEIVDTLDTGAGAFGAKWAGDSSTVTIVYRVDRHAPLKSITYRLAKGRAIPSTKKPVDVKDGALIKFWGDYCSNPNPPQKTFGTPGKAQ